jgi:hypothetical protein
MVAAGVSSLKEDNCKDASTIVMPNYNLLCRNANGDPLSSQPVAAETDAGAICSALDLAKDAIYELWHDDRRVTVFEMNDARTIEPAQPLPRRQGRLQLWSRKLVGSSTA